MALSRLVPGFAVLAFALNAQIPSPSQTQPPVAGPPGATLTRTIQGLVLDNKGVPVSDAVVLLKNTKTLEVRTYLAGKDGGYRFYGLSFDVDYELRAQANGYSSPQKMVTVFDSHKVVKLNLKLKKKLKTNSNH